MKKMKKLRILICVCLVVSMLAGTTSIVFADVTLQSASSTSFSKAWNLTKTGNKNGYWLWMSYGYNTFLINEDTCGADTNGWIHRARIVNGKGTHYGSWYYATGGASSIEVQHNGSSVSYYNMGQ